MLSLRIQKLQNVTILHCAGRFTFSQAVELEAAILQAVRTPVLVLDLMETVAIDAAGLGVLVSVRTWARSTQRILKLMNVMPRVEELLRLTKLYSAFEICRTREMLELMCLAMDTHDSGRSEPPSPNIHIQVPGHGTSGHSLAAESGVS